MIRVTSKIEIHAAHACNLHCSNCTHFSDYDHPGLLSVEEAEIQMRPWGSRVAPAVLTILGGEPTINSRLSDIVLVARKCFPDTPLTIVTNGSFLHRHRDLPEVARRTKTSISITKHEGDSHYREMFSSIERLVAEWRGQGVEITIPEPYPWMRRYHGKGESMLPYADRRPAISWSHCCDEKCRCVQLHEGCLWKCSILAYLPMMKRRFPSLSSSWDLGLSYQPLKTSATDDEIVRFFNLREEPACSLCPAEWIPASEIR